MYSIHNEGKSVVAERFIRTLNTGIYKYMTSVSKNVYAHNLDDIVNEHNNTEVNDKDPKFKVDDHARISKYKTFFAKGYTPNWSEDVFVIKKFKNALS